MLGYQEIKSIIIDKLGLKDMATYRAYIEATFKKTTPISQEEIELLSPDNIDNNAFWRIVEEVFGVDCVANTEYGKVNLSIDEGNQRNLSMARWSGVLNPVDEWRYHRDMPILEIGAGYGSFKHYVQNTTACKYHGVDVYPKIQGVFPTLPNGLLPEEYRTKQFWVIYSSNVFQHLSSKQRTAYFQDVHHMLGKGGMFSFNMMATWRPPAVNDDKGIAYDGKVYLRHYGQFTEIPYYHTLREELDRYYEVLYETRRHDGLITFTCYKRELPVAKVEAT
jgi:hypothetical protein